MTERNVKLVAQLKEIVRCLEAEVQLAADSPYGVPLVQMVPHGDEALIENGDIAYRRVLLGERFVGLDGKAYICTPYFEFGPNGRRIILKPLPTYPEFKAPVFIGVKVPSAGEYTFLGGKFEYSYGTFDAKFPCYRIEEQPK